METFARIAGPGLTADALAGAALRGRSRSPPPPAVLPGRGLLGRAQVRAVPHARRLRVVPGVLAAEPVPSLAALARPARARAVAPGDWAPLRADAAELREFRRGALPDLTCAEARTDAVEDLIAGTYTASSWSTKAHQWRTICRACRFFGLVPLPPTVRAVLAAGAALKAGRYRAASAYLSCYRVTAERQGHDLTTAVKRAFTDAARSCARGLGGPTRALALPLERLALLPSSRTAWVTGAPCRPATSWSSAAGGC